MKISVCGKGGCGKSTITAGLADYYRNEGRSVLVVDLDESNSCLHWMLGMTEPPQSLMDLQPDHQASHYHWPAMHHDLPISHVREARGVRLVVMGKIDHAHQGCACAIGSGGRDFLASLATAPEEVVIADMEAGVEHFGRGIGASVDATLAVVEPSLESLTLAGRIQAMTKDSGAAFAGAVINKAASAQLAGRLSEELARRGVPVLGVLEHAAGVQEAGLAGLALDHRLLGPALPELAAALLSQARLAA